MVGPAGNQYGTAGEAVVHPLSRFLVTGEYSGTELNLLNGDGSTTSVGSIDKETGLSAALCRLGGFSKLVEGQQYTFILGSIISEEARLTVTYQSDFPSDGLTVRNFTATPSDSGDLMVDLSWDHPEAIPDGNSTWYYSLSAFAPGSSSVTLYQKQDGRVTFGKSISVTGQRSATVATDPALGPVTFVLTVSPSGNSSYSVRSSTPGPNPSSFPSSFTETTRPTVSIYTDSLSGLTYTVQAQVTDSWGTPSYAQFPLQQKDGEGYTSTAVTGQSHVSSASFNGSGITSLMKLNLSGLGPGTYRLMAVGYDTCGNASDPA